MSACPSRADRRLSDPEASSGGEAGFTLIEILVAFAIAVTALGALYQLFGAGVQAGAAAGRLETAIVLARSALEAASTAESGERKDRVGPYQRRVLVRPRADLTAPDAPAGVEEITVDVSWRDGPRERSITVTTLHVGPNSVSAGRTR
jgi:general secretion pathway protein I